MAGLMVVELHDQAKRILKENLNSPQSMETSPQRIDIYFKWRDDPPEAFQATACHQIIGPNLYSQSKNCRGTWSGFLLALIAKAQHAVQG
jgi:hypothetical protein